jgi:hypothetical protein
VYKEQQMSRNGSGTYTLPVGNPVVTGTTISSTWANTTLTDIASAITDSLAADGQTTASGNLNMGTNRIVNTDDPTNPQDVATKNYVDTYVGALGSMSTQDADDVAITGGSISSILEGGTVTATAPAASINYDFKTQAVRFYTASNTTNFTVNIRGNSTTTLDATMATGQFATMVLLVTNGATPYYPNVIQIDGVTVTPKYQGGVTITAGNASSIDIYTITIVKTASATFTSFVSQTKFA